MRSLKRSFFGVFLFFTAFSFLVFTPLSASAALVPCGLSSGTAAEMDPCTVCHVVIGGKGIIDYALQLMTYVAIAVIVAMAILYIVSAGNEQRIQLAKTGLKASLIGFAVLLGAWLIVNIILGVLTNGTVPGLQKSEGAFTFTCDPNSTSEAARRNRVVQNTAPITETERVSLIQRLKKVLSRLETAPVAAPTPIPTPTPTLVPAPTPPSPLGNPAPTPTPQTVTIDPVTAKPLTKDAFSAIQAERPDGMEGVVVGPDVPSGAVHHGVVGYMDDGDWLKYSNVDFGTGANGFVASVAVPEEYAGQEVEIRLDSLTTAPAGTLKVAPTGSWEAYSEQSVAIDPVIGRHDVFLLMKGAWGVANLDWLRFTAVAPTPAPAPAPTTVIWTECARENNQCTFSGRREVRYGISGNVITKVAENGIQCNDAEFGAPTTNYENFCWYSSATTTAAVTAPVASYATPTAPSPTPTPAPTPSYPTPSPGGEAGPRVSNFTNSGPINATAGQVISGVKISNPGGDCIRIEAPNVVVRDSEIGPCGGDGNIVVTEGGSGALIEHNKVLSGKRGFLVNQGKAVVRKNIFTGDYSGSGGSSHAAEFQFATGGEFDGNIVRGSGYSTDAVSAFRASNLRITNNDIDVKIDEWSAAPLMVGDADRGTDPGHDNYIAGNIIRREGGVPAGLLGSSGNSVMEKNCLLSGLQSYDYSGTFVGVTIRNNVINMSMGRPSGEEARDIQGWDTNIDSTNCSLIPGGASVPSPIPSPVPAPAPQPTFNFTATDWIEAEKYTAQNGTEMIGSDGEPGGNQAVGYTDEGDYLKYEKVNFGSTTLRGFAAKLAVEGEYAGQQIEVRLDTLSGTVLGILTVGATSGWGSFTEQGMAIGEASGIHDLYLVFRGGSGIGNIDMFQFMRNAPLPAPTPVPAPAPVPAPTPVTWTQCAAENNFCPFTGRREVRYGIEGNVITKVAQDGILCNDAEFGASATNYENFCWYNSATTSASITAPVASYSTPATPTPAPAPTPSYPTPSSGGAAGPRVSNFTSSGPINASSGQVISGVRISNSGGPCITISAPNVVVRDSNIGPCGGGANIVVTGSNALIEHNHIHNGQRGVLATNTSGVTTSKNTLDTFFGPFPEGTAIEYDYMGSGVIDGNVVTGSGYASDVLSAFQSSNMQMTNNRIDVNIAEWSAAAFTMGDAVGGGDPGHNNYVAGNIVYQTGGVPAGVFGSSSNTTLERNCLTAGIQAYNYSGTFNGVTVRNNVINIGASFVPDSSVIAGWGSNINSTDCSLVP